MTKVKINSVSYPATINGTACDTAWDGRESKAITLTMTAAVALTTFVDDAAWSILLETQQAVLGEDGTPTGSTETVTTEYDNSAYSIAGDVIDHRDGTVTVKMGKPTDLEDAYEELYGGAE